MKLIMENWREYVNDVNDVSDINESTGDQLAQALIAQVQGKAKKKGKKGKKGEPQELNEEIFTLAAMAVPFFLKLVGSAAMASAVAKFGSWVQKKFTGNESEFLNKTSEVFEKATRMIATLGITSGAKKLVNWYYSVRPNRKAKRKWLARIELTEGLVTMAVLMFGAYREIAAAAQEAGGVGKALAGYFQEAGLQDEGARAALIDAFETAVDVGEAGASGVGASELAQASSIDKDIYWATIKRTLKTAWDGSR